MTLLPVSYIIIQSFSAPIYKSFCDKKEYESLIYGGLMSQEVKFWEAKEINKFVKTLKKSLSLIFKQYVLNVAVKRTFKT